MMQFEFELVIPEDRMNEVDALEELGIETCETEDGLGFIGRCDTAEDYEILKATGLAVKTVFIDLQAKPLFKGFDGWRSAENAWAMDAVDNDMDFLLEYISKQ